jgi:hypothetical protein
MTRRLLLVLLILAGALAAQRRVDPKNTYHRILVVVPVAGTGTDQDPFRPKYAPWPHPEVAGPADIIGYVAVPSDDHKHFVVEFAAKDRAAFAAILKDQSVVVFEKGISASADIEAALKVYKKDFDLSKFGVVLP